MRKMGTREKLNIKLKESAVRKYQCALCPYSTQILQYYKRHMTTHSSEKPFKCPECPYRAKRKPDVKLHVQNVHLLRSTPISSPPFPCPHPGCSYAAKDKLRLARHANVHSGEKSFFCSHPKCNFSTNEKQSLIQHTRLHTGEKPFRCQFESCSYAAAVQSNLVKHLRTHTKERPYKCPEANCEYAAAEQSNVKRHQVTRHQPKEGEERPSFSCPLCEYSSKLKAHLTQHIKTHTLEKLFKCDEPNCNFEARKRAEIESHKLVQSDEKSVACSFESCEFRCKSKAYLSAHLKRHSEERRYKCELCLFRAKTRNDVTAHIKQVHSDARRFKCTEPNCDSKFKKNGPLTLHLLNHKGVTKYACSFPLCEYKSIHNTNVKTHEYRIHSEGKKEKCTICDYKCKMKSDLLTHIRTHTKEEPFACKEEGCVYRAKSSSALRKHEKKIHVELLRQNK